MKAFFDVTPTFKSKYIVYPSLFRFQNKPFDSQLAAVELMEEQWNTCAVEQRSLRSTVLLWKNLSKFSNEQRMKRWSEGIKLKNAFVKLSIHLLYWPECFKGWSSMYKKSLDVITLKIPHGYFLFFFQQTVASQPIAWLDCYSEGRYLRPSTTLLPSHT